MWHLGSQPIKPVALHAEDKQALPICMDECMHIAMLLSIDIILDVCETHACDVAAGLDHHW